MNALAKEKSPYLLQHQDNPVAWRVWGEEAFAAARAEDKPVFLSIGYSTCHWCHVMAHESFEDEATARLMNEKFINIKVDREERPDVDRLYMAFVQATTGSGGWPMSVWLTPGGKPFFGGTYFPPDDRYGRASFSRILEQISKLWWEDRPRIESEAARVMGALDQASEVAGDEVPGEKWIVAGREAFARAFDAERGGFGGAPKFPRPVILNFLERGDGQARLMAHETLRAMCRGGMYDHLGGGFHRYSVDGAWHVPHFEKMLYDQGQIVVALVEAWQVSRDPLFEAVARETLAYVARDLSHAGGGFFSAEDADSLIAHGRPEHAEGAFYVWTHVEIAEALGGEVARRLSEFYGVRPDGNAPEGTDPHGEFTGKNILVATGATDGAHDEMLASARKALLKLRNHRPRPHLDDKVLAAWNGLMISGFARAAAAFDDPALLQRAERAADFVWNNMRDADGNLLRSWREGPSAISGYCEDYAFLIQAFLDLYEAGFDLRWIEAALDLQVRQDGLFLDEGRGDYFSSVAGDPLVPLRLKEDYDGAEPSANSISALNLLRLGRALNREEFLERAGKILAIHSPQIERAPTAVPQMLVALDLALCPPEQAVVAAESRESALPLLRELNKEFRPRTVKILLDGPEAVAFFAGNNPAMVAMKPVDGMAALYLCKDFACQAPVTRL